MENQRNFKPLIPKTNNPSTKGELPVKRDLVDIGLTEAGANGEAIIKGNSRVQSRKPKSLKVKSKDKNKNSYPLHRIIELENRVQIVVEPKSKVEITNFTDFIHASESENYSDDIVDILPRIIQSHFDIISKSESRFMIGDEVIVNFKYRSINIVKNMLQRQPVVIKDIQFVALNNITVIIAYLKNNDYYPINELDHYVRN